MKKIHYIYTDNIFFRQLVKKNNENLWNSFYDSMIQIVPSLNKGLYRQIFTCFSLLESMVDPNVKTDCPHLNWNVWDALRGITETQGLAEWGEY